METSVEPFAAGRQVTLSHYADYNGKHSSHSEASPAQAKEVGAIATSLQRQETGSAVTAPVHITQPLRGGLRVHIRADWGPLSTTLLPTAFLTPGATTGV